MAKKLLEGEGWKEGDRLKEIQEKVIVMMMMIKLVIRLMMRLMMRLVMRLMIYK